MKAAVGTVVYASLVLSGLALAKPAPPTSATAALSSANPFFAQSTLPYQAPPFDRIQDADYRPAIEAGMAQELADIQAIADNPATPTFENTLVAMQKSGRLLERARLAFNLVADANTNAALQATKAALAPEFAAHEDAIHLNARLFARIEAVYRNRHARHYDAESLRLIELTYAEFVHSGAKLSADDKAQLSNLNEEASRLSDDFSRRLLAATKEGAYHTDSAEDLAGLSEAQLAAASRSAQGRGESGYTIPLQNTTQQPLLGSLQKRAVRQAIFDRSWGRAEKGDANDTRDIVARLAELRARRAQLLGYPTHAAWKLADQMAKTPEAAQAFMDALVPAAKSLAMRESADIQAVIDAQDGGFKVAPWDWDRYQERVRSARFNFDAAQVKPYFELGNVLVNGVFYAANQLYGLTFTERQDLPVYQSDVRVFEVHDANGKALALFYGDYFKRDNKNGGAWMSVLVAPSRLLGSLPVIYNVANLPKPAPGSPALISFEDVRTMFHEFGHALHSMLTTARYPSLAGTATPRDFVEFPSQFNEHWALYPSVLAHYARHFQTGAAMPPELTDKIKQTEYFGEGYRLTELLAAAQLDMQWHTLPAAAPRQDPDQFEKAALIRTHLDLPAVPPRYRSSYFSHIWSGGYSAGYYAYLWTQMLDDDAYQWFDEHGGLSRENGDRFRRMILSRGNTVDLAALYAAWRGRSPTIDAMKKYRDLE